MLCASHSVSSKAGFLLPLTIALMALLAAPRAAGAQETPRVLDHYRCYTLLLGPSPGPAVAPLVALLQDQFDIRRQIVETVEVLTPTRFCNPVEKRIENPRTGEVDTTPITDRRAHLTLYPIKDKVIHRPVTWAVVVSNQFGTQKLQVRRSRFLGVPTFKEPTSDELETLPDHPDHFKCYDAVGDQVGLKVALIDQFEPANMVVLDPKLFCNPTRKTVPNGSVGVENAEAHLTCYDLIAAGQFSVTTLIDKVIRNQFTPTTGDIEAITDDDLLCVPSRKVSFAATGPVITAVPLPPDDPR